MEEAKRLTPFNVRRWKAIGKGIKFNGGNFENASCVVLCDSKEKSIKCR